jgi:serine/threonine protein phosphatase 1
MPNQNLIAIGDIHGCLHSLEELIAKLALTGDEHLIFLGDYIDRGPDSKGVIDFLLSLSTKVHCTFLKGNHEQMMIDFLDFGKLKHWQMNGGEQTLTSYQNERGEFEIPPEHAKFIGDGLYYFETDEFFFVHGGIKPNRTVVENLKRMHGYDMLWEREHLDSKYLASENYPWEKTVVCGHTPQPKAIVTDKLICIDTGCVYETKSGYGHLTAICLPSREIVQVENASAEAVKKR